MTDTSINKGKKTVVMIAVIAIIIAIITGVNANSKEIPQHVTLHLFDQGTQDFHKYVGGSDVYPTGSSFSDLFWSREKYSGIVTVAHKDFSITFPHAYHVLGSGQDNNHSGISGIDIGAYLNGAEHVSSEEAYKTYVQLVKNINAHGWQQYFRPSQPRIAKDDNFRYIKESSLGDVSNSREILSYKQWREVMNGSPRSMYFHLYQDGILLTININKKDSIQPKPTEDTLLEKYELLISFATTAIDGRLSLPDGFAVEGAELRKMYDDTMKHYAKNRLKEEQELREQGYHIDESYVTPDFWEYMQ